MNKHLPFKIRLMLSFWSVLALAFIFPSFYYHRILEREILEEAKADAYRQLHLVSWLFSQEDRIRDAASLDHWCTELGKRLGVRITYMDGEGRVIGDSEVPPDQINALENHAGRPEIMQLRDQETGMSTRFSRTVQKDLIYVAKTVQSDKPVPSGAIRLSVPFSSVKDRVDSLGLSFWAIIALAFGATIVLSSALARRLRHPVRDITRVAEAMSNGDFKQRIHLFPNQEFYPLAESLNRMGKHIEAHIQEITDQKVQLEAILNGMREGVMFLDSQCRIRAINRSLSAIVSNPPQCLGRQPMEALLSPELQAACERVSNGEDHQQLEIRLGNERFYDINVVRLNDPRGKKGAVVVLHDISQLKRLEKVRQDFVANVSHELRTPLTSIKGYAETLLSEDAPDREEARSFLETILKNADNMSKMVNDLLQLAKLEARFQEGPSEPVDVSAALSMAWETCAPMAKEKNIELENRLPRDGLQVSADPGQLIQVLQNLLENAIRYSPSGKKITVSSQSDLHHVTLAVQDKGPGIAKAHQQRIFERFYRVDKHRAGGSGGTGLGLAICRHIVRNHGGRRWVESRPGEGSTFFVSLRKPAQNFGEPGAIALP